MNMGARWLALLLVTTAVAVQLEMVTCQGADVDVCEAPPKLPDVSPSSYGKEFFIAIPEIFGFNVKPELIIGTYATNASYSVETTAGVIQMGDVSFDKPVNVTLSDEYILLGSADREKGIHIRAIGKESIFVLVTIVQFAGFGDFLAYPCQSFETDSYIYFAVSTTSTSQGFSSEVVLVACEDQTEVTITPTETVNLPQDAQDPESPSFDVVAGNNHTVTLNQMQTLLVSTMGADLTGTKVVSNKPLTVISGHECGNVPETFLFCEQLAVQVPPTLTWGTEFLLAPFAGRTSGQYYKVVTADNDTTIVYRCGALEALGTVLSEPGESFLFRTNSSNYCYLLTSKPVFVVQMATGGFTPADNLGDPVMAIVSPIQQYVSGASFLSLETVEFLTHAISVTVATKHFRSLDILFDGLPLDCAWNTIQDLDGCVVGFGCTMTISSGSHTVSHDGEGGLLSVIAYGFDTSPLQGYAYHIGINLEKREEFDNETEPDIPDVELPELVPYYSLDDLPGVRELKREKDANSESISIPSGMLFGNRIVTQAYVSENGVISFDAPWKFSHPSRFPSDYFYTRNAYVVAPFWSDNDIRREGTVRYVAFEKGDSTEGDNMFDEVSGFVQGQRSEEDERDEFQGTWMLVAQWDHVHPDPHGADDHMGIPEALLERTNTYQAIIVTDGIYSSNLFTYACGDIEWSATGNRPAVVGYNAGGTYFENHRSSGFDTVGNDVSCVVELGFRSKRQAGGTMVTVDMEFDIDTALIEATRPCRTHYEIDRRRITELTFSDPVLPCPCTLNQAQNDLRFELDTRFRNAARSTCYTQTIPNTGPSAVDPRPVLYGQQCCYDDNNNGVRFTAPPNAGTLRIYGPVEIQDDMRFYDFCCIEGGGLGCDLFYVRRPRDRDCAEYSPPTCCATGYGDPHYWRFPVGTARYAFFGTGQYLLLEVGPDRSQIQGILHNFPGGFISWHTSFAFGEPGPMGFAYQFGNPINYEFMLRKTRGLNAGDVTAQIATVGDTIRDDKLTITRISSYQITVVFNSGLFLELSWPVYSSGFVNGRVRATVLEEYAEVGMSRGIMGSTASQDFDADWLLAPGESMFEIVPPVSRKRRQATDPSLDFIFPDPPAPFSIANLNYTEEQRQFCNNDPQCMFDLMVTRSTAIAADTMGVAVDNVKQADALNNFPPNMTGEDVFNVTVGEESVYGFSVMDEKDNFTVEVMGELPEGAALEGNGGGEYTYRWNLQAVTNATDVSTLEFVATDSAGASSLLSPQLIVCPCANGGECTLDGIINTMASVIIMNCNCPEAYGGDLCEEDRNGCSEIQCFEGVECLDMAAPGVGAMCGPCPDGYTGDGEKCFDIDECMLDLTLCEQICNNTAGSYECSCEQGYQLVEGTNQCEDIDECGSEGVNDCQQGCTNTVGYFNCSCQEGFTLNADGKSCDADVPCANNGGCSHTCAVIDGREECFCPPGFVLHIFNEQVCVDEDECLFSSPCNQTCTNTFGSFECSCINGYTLLDDATSCGDVNECVEATANQSDLCPANTVCVNTIGSFECICVPGFELVDGTCQRIVEDITSAPEVQQVVPTSGEDNSQNFTVTTFSGIELTADVIQLFRKATAQAVTRYCSQSLCTTINATSHTQSAPGIKAEPGNVAVPKTSIGKDSSGNPVLSFFVQLSPSLFLTAETLATAVEQAKDLYEDSGFLLRECNFTCPDGYSLDKDCTGCELTSICLADNPCLNGGTCYLVTPPNDYRCDCPEAATGDHCEGAFIFTNNTPRIRLNDDGKTYTISVEFSPGNGGSFHCTLRELGVSTTLRRQCDSLHTDFTDVNPGGKYAVKVIRLSERIREVISEEVIVPLLTT